MSMVQKVSRNESRRIAGRRGMIFRVTRGRLWLTRDGDIRDYILSAGDSVELVAAGAVVLFGLTESFFQVDTPVRAPGVWSGILARLT
jgi:Protein of unknown function (DUF2917)